MMGLSIVSPSGARVSFSVTAYTPPSKFSSNEDATASMKTLGGPR